MVPAGGHYQRLASRRAGHEGGYRISRCVAGGGHKTGRIMRLRLRLRVGDGGRPRLEHHRLAHRSAEHLMANVRGNSRVCGAHNNGRPCRRRRRRPVERLRMLRVGVRLLLLLLLEVLELVLLHHLIMQQELLLLIMQVELLLHFLCRSVVWLLGLGHVLLLQVLLLLLQQLLLVALPVLG